MSPPPLAVREPRPLETVTLQCASLHLRVDRVFGEVFRVLKPGGRFHHCDKLRPGNPALEKLYFAYLRMSHAFTGLVFHSSPAAMNCRRYFIRTLAMFYSADELSMVLDTLGFRDISTRTIFAGMIGCHGAAKPPTA